ncbi:beclin-1-like protein A [Hydra vulgaris]|uniref:Beclin-1-like protein A n=1 Tax=Hydra vulgaris TaxID=6087 RepID=A0ABM4BNP4_HYDVU
MEENLVIKFFDENIILRDEDDSDNFNQQIFESQYYTVFESFQYLQKKEVFFSILNINVRSLKKNFENFKLLLDELKHDFKIICLTETWCKCGETNAEFELINYKSVHQPRNFGIGGGVSIFIHNSINYSLRNDLCVNEIDCESLCIELKNKNTKNIIVNATYRPPSGNLKKYKTHLKSFITAINKTRDHVFLAGDLNIDLKKHASNNNVKNFLNTLLQSNLIPTINKPTRVTNNSSTLLDNIITNNFHNNRLNTGIIKTDLSDHFPTFLVTNNIINNNIPSKTTIFRRQINENSVKQFQNLLRNNVDWNLVLQSNDANNSYDLFLSQFCKQYETAFPEKQIIVNTKTVMTPWMSNGLLKSSKRKQKLYDKYLKKKTYKNEMTYKNYKNVFEKTKKISKKLYYAKLLNKASGNTKKTWNVIKEVIGKNNYTRNTLPKKITVNDKNIYDKSIIAEKINSFFINAGLILASKFPLNSTSFESYLKNYDKVMDEPNLKLIELRTAFSNLKNNKSAGFDKINVNVVESVYHIIEPLLFHIFNLSFKTGIVPEKLKIARITPVFNGEILVFQHFT